MKKILYLAIILVAFIFLNSSSQAACVDLTSCQALYSERINNKLDAVTTAINFTNGYSNINTTTKNSLISDWRSYQDNYLEPLLGAIEASTSENNLFELMNNTDIATMHMVLVQASFYYSEANQLISNIQDSYVLINESFDYVIEHTRAESYTNSLSYLDLVLPKAYAAAAGDSPKDGDTKFICGNGVKDPNEECDDPNDSWCTNDCRLIYLDDNKEIKDLLDKNLIIILSEQSAMDSYVVQVDDQLTAITKLDLSNNSSLSDLQDYRDGLDSIQTSINNSIIEAIENIEDLISY